MSKQILALLLLVSFMLSIGIQAGGQPADPARPATQTTFVTQQNPRFLAPARFMSYAEGDEPTSTSFKYQGAAIFNDTSKVLRYYNGTDWIDVGNTGIGGTIDINQVAIGSGLDTIQGYSTVLYNGTSFIIGATSANTTLYVRGTPYTGTAGVRAVVTIHDNATQAIGTGGGLLFTGNTVTTSSEASFAQIQGAKENATANNTAAYMALSTRPAGDGAMVEAMRITSTQSVQVGSPSGGDIGAGKVNTSAGCFKNGVEYGITGSTAIGGSIALNQVAFGSGTNTIQGSTTFISDGTYLILGATSSNTPLYFGGTPYTGTVGVRAIATLHDSATQADGVGGGLLFTGNTVTTGSAASFAQIRGFKEGAGSGDTAASMVLSTRPTGAGAMVEAMRINSSQYVGIGITPTIPLHLLKNGVAFSGNTVLNAAFLETAATVKGIYTGYDTTAQVAAIVSGSAGVASHTDFWTYSGSAWAARVRISSTAIIGGASNTYDVGASGTTWRTGYFGTSVVIAGTMTASNGLINTTGALAINTTNNQAISTGTGTITLAGKTLTSAARFETNQGADVTAGTTITLGTGNYFKVTGTTTIAGIVTTNWQAGSMVVLDFTGVPGPTVTNASGAPGASAVAILLAAHVDLTTAARTLLTLVYDGTNWIETARTVL